jgi:metallo-beta-lactamase family protein
MGLFIPIGYDQKVELDKDIICFFRDAGHVLGSAMVEVWVRKQPHQGEFTKIVFSGDIGNPDLKSFALLNKPTYLNNPDYVIMESTYGDRDHDTTKDAKDLLEDVIENAVASGGVLMIPISAMEKTQQVLYHLNELAENKRIPYVPIYVDSPLAIRLTEVYQKHSIYLNKDARELIGAGEAIFRFPGLNYTASVNESKMINRVLPPKIVLAGSSMSTGGRIIHHESRYLSDPNSTLLLVSYQAQGTPGRQIQNGAKEVQLGDQRVELKARVEIIGHYSDHIDQAELFKWVAHFKNSAKKIFITHGDEDVSIALRQVIMDNLGVRPEIPQMGDVFDIDITQ